jgi:lysophospholipase L1-like esterase
MRTQILSNTLAFFITLFISSAFAAESDFYTPKKDQYDSKKDAAKIEEGKPNVLLIGDSIMGGYYKGVQQLLKSEANVCRHPGNAGDTINGLKNLDAWLGDTKWDVIHFNWGLHDLCYRNPESKEQGHRDKVNGRISVPLEDYEKNLEALVQRLLKTKAKLIWATTTKVPEGEVGRFPGDEDKYNQAAARVMERHGIPINDLNKLSDSFEPKMFSKPGDVHYSGSGCGALAKQVAEAIRTHGLQDMKK